MRLPAAFCVASACLTSTCAHQEQIALVNSLKGDTKTAGLFEFHKELVEISSVSGNESHVGGYLSKYLQRLGMHTYLQIATEEQDESQPFVPLVGSNVPNGRFNVYASYSKEASRSRPRVMLSSHIDTVPPFYPYNTSGPSLEPDTWISGRGSVDDKGPLAAQVFAVKELIEAGQLDKSDVGLLFVVDEEVDGIGMKSFSPSTLAKQITTDYTRIPTVIFGEPTEGNLVCGHKGIVMFTMRAVGKAAHSGYPWLGVSANDMMVKALAAIQRLAETGNLPSSEKYGQTTVNIGEIHGGVAANVVAQESMTRIAVRLAAADPETIKAIIAKAVDDATRDLVERGGKIDFKYSNNGYPPVEIDCKGPEGFDTMTVNYGTDVPSLLFDGSPYKRFLYGPGSIFVAHSDHEMLQVKDMTKAVEDYKKLILYSLGSS